jgi:hypothetical protein
VTIKITAGQEYFNGGETWVEITLTGVEAGIATDPIKLAIVTKECKAFASSRREPRGPADNKEELRFWLTVKGRDLSKNDIHLVDSVFYEAVYLTLPARCTSCNYRSESRAES